MTDTPLFFRPTRPEKGPHQLCLACPALFPASAPPEALERHVQGHALLVLADEGVSLG
jgi:hypothetical protein